LKLGFYLTRRSAKLNLYSILTIKHFEKQQQQFAEYFSFQRRKYVS